MKSNFGIVSPKDSLNHFSLPNALGLFSMIFKFTYIEIVGDGLLWIEANSSFFGNTPPFSPPVAPSFHTLQHVFWLSTNFSMTLTNSISPWAKGVRKLLFSDTYI